jgi:hypothetical protein
MCHSGSVIYSVSIRVFSYLYSKVANVPKQYASTKSLRDHLHPGYEW